MLAIHLSFSFILLQLMEGADAKHFMTHFNKILVPFLERLEVLEPGSRETLVTNFLLHLSTTSLELPIVFFKESFADTTSSSVTNVDESIGIGVDCIYVYDGEEDQARILKTPLCS